MQYRKANGEVVSVYTAEERKRAMQVSLTALAASLGFTPVRQGNHYSLKEIDSLVIYNDKSWYRWSGKGDRSSGSQIDFMLEFGNAGDVPEAIRQLLDFNGENVPEVYTERRQPAEGREQKQFVLPPENRNYRRLYAYLIQTRALSKEVVSEFVHRRLIYEDAVHHNIVFCGRDPQGEIRYAGLRGTADLYGRKFKMDVPGNDKNYGVNIVNRQSGMLKVFESVIDCMSYMDMYGDYDSNKLVLGMVEDNPLVQFLQDYAHITDIAFCLDNDAAGRKAVYGEEEPDKKNKPGLKEKYEQKGYTVSVEVPPEGKDWNEALVAEKNAAGMKPENTQENFRRHKRGR